LRLHQRSDTQVGAAQVGACRVVKNEQYDRFSTEFWGIGTALIEPGPGRMASRKASTANSVINV
jgi:hypothetical protein